MRGGRPRGHRRDAWRCATRGERITRRCCAPLIRSRHRECWRCSTCTRSRCRLPRRHHPLGPPGAASRPRLMRHSMPSPIRCGALRARSRGVAPSWASSTAPSDARLSTFAASRRVRGWDGQAIDRARAARSTTAPATIAGLTRGGVLHIVASPARPRPPARRAAARWHPLRHGCPRLPPLSTPAT